MKHYTLLFVTFLLGFCQFAYGQANSDAIKNADAFLAGLKIADIPEGKQAMLAAAWGSVDSIPVVQEQKTLYEGMFDTDVPGVQGFKRLLEMKVQSKANTTLTARYLLISYKDRKSGVWKVFDMRDLGSDTIESTIAFFKKNLTDTRNVPAQSNYRTYAYWLTFAGKLQEARQSYLTAIELNKNQPAKYFNQSGADKSLAVLNAIAGE